jgi:hypothetical protein
MLILLRQHQITPAVERIGLRVPNSSMGVCNIAEPTLAALTVKA